VKSELALFDPPMSQVSMERSAWVDVYPLATLDGGPVEFLISGTQDDYLDLNDTILYVKLKITKADGSNLDAAGKVYLANLTLSSLFADVSLFLNEHMVEGGHYLYPYKAYMSTILQFDESAKNTQLQAAGYEEETDERVKWFTGSKSKEFMGPLHLDLFQQSRYLLPGVNVRIKMSRSKVDFVTINEGKKGEVKIKLESAILSVRKVKVSPAVILGHDLGLNNHNATYPIQQSEMLTYTIAKGSTTHTQDNLCRGALPKLLIIGLVGNGTFSGDTKQDPMIFTNAKLNYLALYRDGESAPYTQPFQPDFENEMLVLRPYMAMIQGLEMYNSNQSNNITIDDFVKGKTLFIFNLTPDLNASGSCGQPYRTGNLRLEMKFAKALDEAINVIMFAIRDGKIEICKDRQVVKST